MRAVTHCRARNERKGMNTGPFHLPDRAAWIAEGLGGGYQNVTGDSQVGFRPSPSHIPLRKG